jgi:hypothetical protein
MTEVRTIDGRGRCLIATAPYAAGETIALHQPLVAVVAPAWREYVCWNCFTPSRYPKKHPIVCQGSCGGAAHFCSSACQQQQQEDHRHEPNSPSCGATGVLYRHLREMGKADDAAWTSAAAALVLEALIRSGTDPELWPKLMKLCFLEWENVERNLRGEMDEVIDTVTIYMYESFSSSPAAAKIIIEKARALLLRSECNAFSFWSTDGAQDQLGVGLFLEAAMFNHSCMPNVGKVLKGRNLRFVALREIAVGEELCISYVSLDEECETRRGILKKHFHFECTCVRCEKKEEEEDGLIETLAHKGCGGAWVAREGNSSSHYCSLCKQDKA